MLLLAHCVEHSWSSDSVGSHTAIRIRSSKDRGDHDDTVIIIPVRQIGSETLWYVVKAGGEKRTAGSDKLHRPQQYTTAKHAHVYGCIAHARRVGGRVGTKGPVHVFCCVPGICPDGMLTAHSS